MRQALLAALLVLTLTTLGAARGENLYVTPAGAGSANGSDWSNAFAGFADVVWGSGAGQLGAGDTLWIAGGTYAETLNINGSGAEGSLLYIKRARATNSECANATGWAAGYDAQVAINATLGVSISSSALSGGAGRYVVVDGQTTNGIKVSFGDTSGARGISIEGYNGFHSIFRYIEVSGPSTAIGYGFVNDVRGFWIGTYDGRANTDRPSDITLEYCNFHGVCAMGYFVHVSNITNQHNEAHTIETEGSEVHQNLIYTMSSDNCVFRWNYVHDMGGSVGIFFTDFGSDAGVQSSNMWIYGNLFRDSDYTSSRFIDVRDSATGTGPIFIYNNTFVSSYGAISIGVALNPNAESYIRNNLFVDISQYQIALPGGEDYVTASDNITTTSYTNFVDAGSTGVLAAPYDWQYVRDLHLVSPSAPIDAGVDLGAPYNVDYDGTTRSGTWDIGAYEYGASPTPPPPGGTPRHIRATTFRPGTVRKL